MKGGEGKKPVNPAVFGSVPEVCVIGHQAVQHDPVVGAVDAVPAQDAIGESLLDLEILQVGVVEFMGRDLVLARRFPVGSRPRERGGLSQSDIAAADRAFAHDHIGRNPWPSRESRRR